MSENIRGSLARGRRKVKSGSVQPRFGSDDPVLIVGEIVEPLPKRAARGTLTLVLLLLSTVSVLYLVTAATVLAVIPSGGQHGALVLRGAFPQGGATVGTFGFASSEEAPRGPGARLWQAFAGAPHGSVVEVVSRPGNKIANGPDGTVTENGTPTGYTAKVQPRLLIREYLALCVSGGCGQPGDPVLIPQTNMIGGVKAMVGLDGVHRLHSARVTAVR